MLAVVGTMVVPAVVSEGFPPTVTDLTRTWTCRYPHATETLTFRPAGERVQTITFNSGRFINNSGRWSFHPSTDEQSTDVTVVDNAFGGPAADLAPTSTLWCMPAQRSVTGSVYLVVNEDVGLYFK